jgi:hypothetical protein
MLQQGNAEFRNRNKAKFRYPDRRNASVRPAERENVVIVVWVFGILLFEFVSDLGFRPSELDLSVSDHRAR